MIIWVFALWVLQGHKASCSAGDSVMKSLDEAERGQVPGSKASSNGTGESKFEVAEMA